METIRDSAFGKLTRIAFRHQVFQYPEEKDRAFWGQCIEQDRPDTPEDQIDEENNTHASNGAFGVYTLYSQVSRPQVRQTRSSRSTLSGRQERAESSDLEKISPKDSQVQLVGWAGEDDSENPQNWSVTKKMCESSQVWILTFSIYIGSAIYSPGIPDAAHDFGVSTVTATLGLTMFVLGYGFGPMVWSPLSELPAVGRSPTYVLTLVVFVFLQFAVIYSVNIGMFLAFRFITGFVGSPALATGAASMGDMWSPRVRDYMIAVWGAFAISAPVLGPVIGGFASAKYGWTWTIWPLLWVSGFTLVLLFFFLPETYGPNILFRRARRMRIMSGDKSYISQGELELQDSGFADVLFEALVRPFVLTFCEPIVLIMDVWIALIYGILYIWFEAFPIVFEEIHGFNSGQGGLAFMGILVSTFFTLIGYFLWKYFYQSKYFDAAGENMAPEHQLPSACFGAICMPLSLFWFGWTGNFESVHWIVPIIASMLFSVGGCLIFNSIFTYQAHAYPKFAASVLAGNDCLRSSFGAGFPLFATAMFHNLGVGWACTLLGCLTLCFLPFPFVLYRYGRSIRLESKFARHDI